MYATILSESELQDAAPNLFRSLRRGEFPQAFAHQLHDDPGLYDDEAIAIGAELEQAMLMKDGPGKDKRLCRLAVQVARLLGLNGRPSDDPRRQALVDDIFELARRHNGTRSWEAPPSTVLIGYVVAAAEHALAFGLPYSPGALAETAHAATAAHHLPFSRTDVRDTVRAMTQARPIVDWLDPDEVERLRTRTHDWLIESLRSPYCTTWLAEIVPLPGASDWLVDQMRTPDERSLLRERLAELRRSRTPRAMN